MSTKLLSKEHVNADLVLAMQATFLSHLEFKQAATALATELATKLDLDRISIGISVQGQTEVQAISHTTDIESKYEQNRLIASAMNEAIEQSSVITHPQRTGSQPYIVLAHTKLTKGIGHQVCTLPLIQNECIFGAITIERHADTTLDNEEMATLENLVSLLSPILHLEWKAQQPWTSRLKQSWIDWKHHLSTDSNRQFKIGLYALSILLLASLFIPIRYHISAPARLEGAIQRALVAPENGYLQEAYVRPGDSVSQGQILIDLADEELLLEKRRRESELTQFNNAYATALAQSDRVQMSINQSKAEVARSELSLVEEKLSRSHVLAPFDGVIIQGDLLQSLGAPVKRGDVLLSISPADAYRLIVEVDERDIAKVILGQQGKVALVSLPGEKIVFDVARMTPVATTKEGRNFFEVEGLIAPNNPMSLRPGLEGIAKIEAGKRPFIWTLTHRLTEWMSMTLWSWGF